MAQGCFMSTIILGAGTIGYDIAQQLSREHREVILVEVDPDRIAEIEEDEHDIQVIAGSAADPESLVRAGLSSADLVVAVTNSDEANISACLLASRLAPGTRRVARIRHMDTRRYGQLLLGDPPILHAIINPEELCARRIADLIAKPGAIEVIWLVDQTVALVRIPVTPGMGLIGQNLIQLGQKREASKLPFLLALLVRDDQAFIPKAQEVLRAGDHLYLVSPAALLDKVMDFFCEASTRRPQQHITLFGGGNIGLYLAELLTIQGRTVKLIEPDPARATMLAARLDNTQVLCGEPLDPDIFEAERIASSDVFVAVSDDQEDNLMAALYAKSHGVRFGVAMLTRPQIARLVAQVGIDAAILPQHVAIGTILEHIRTGDVYSVIVLQAGEMEIIETRVPEGSRLTGRPLADVHMPPGTLLLAVQRGSDRTIIPQGKTVVQAGDRIAVITRKSNLQHLEKLLAGRTGWLQGKGS